MSVTCEYCNKVVKSNIEEHYKTNKCILAQEEINNKLKILTPEEEEELEFGFRIQQPIICLACRTIFPTYKERKYHQKTCIFKRLFDMDNCLLSNYLEQNNEIKDLKMELYSIKKRLKDLENITVKNNLNVV